jgi:hypothetical protein
MLQVSLRVVDIVPKWVQPGAVRLVSAAVVAVAAMALAPAPALARKGSIFDLTLARGFEKVTFKGDSAAGCAARGTCGFRGSTTYRIGGKPKGTIVVARSNTGKITGDARYQTKGITRTRVTEPGSATPCTYEHAFTHDVFALRSTGSKFQNLLLSYHPGGGHYLDVGCPSPNEKDLRGAGALPEGSFRAADFHGPKLGFSFSGSLPFTAAGFSATSEWDLSYKAKARACNPNCRLPARRPR